MITNLKPSANYETEPWRSVFRALLAYKEMAVGTHTNAVRA